MPDRHFAWPTRHEDLRWDAALDRSWPLCMIAPHPGDATASGAPRSVCLALQRLGGAGNRVKAQKSRDLPAEDEAAWRGSPNGNARPQTCPRPHHPERDQFSPGWGAGSGVGSGAGGSLLPLGFEADEGFEADDGEEPWPLRFFPFLRDRDAAERPSEDDWPASAAPRAVTAGTE